ncbi:MAG: D-alanine--D-alanine ligase [Planctomycetota bacterium]|nr:D-alanine--D-alanine ligase [Planctomycetota bacterium]
MNCDRTTETLDVTVLMGGPGSEREVSILSGTAIADALERLGHNVGRADISPEDTSALDRDGIDVVFIALHGQFGETGEVQELCERRGLCYTGSGPQASRLAMDKAAAKEIFRDAGVPTPDWAVVEARDNASDCSVKLKALAGPVVVKPVSEGSSVDITIARDDAQRDAAIRRLLKDYGRAMVERFIPGRELTVSILGDDALPVLEVVPAREFYDYTAKYADGAGTQYVFEHGLDESLVRAVQQAAGKAHRLLGCRDMSRVDFILDPAGAAHVLEVNTIPGFTSHSLLPMAALRASISFEQLIDRFVAMATRRRTPERNF